MKHISACILILVCTLSAKADTQAIPDSLLTIDHIYQYTFTDYDKSMRIAGLMRKHKKEPAFTIDVAEGDLHYNNHKYHQALKCYTQAMQSDSVVHNSERVMKLLHRFISCYDSLHNEEKKAGYIAKLLHKAQAEGDQVMESIAYFNMGKMLYYQRDKERGYQLIYKAIELMENSDYEYKKDNLVYDYNTLYIMLQMDRQYPEALAVLDKLEAVINLSADKLVNMDGIDRKERKTMYAHRAFILSKLNRKAEAARAYTTWKEAGNINDKDNYLIIPYLMTIEQYDEVIRLNRVHEEFIQQNGDTITYHMRTIKRTTGRAYEAKGEYKKAMQCFESLAVLTDSLKTREQKSAALELATVYETMEKEAQIRQKDAALQLRNLWLLSTSVIILLLMVLLWRNIQHMRTIRKKNRIMANTLNQLMEYKDERREKDESGKAGNDTIVTPDHSNKALFAKLNNLVVDDKLYLDRTISREQLMKFIGVDKNRFAQIIKEETQTNITSYLNNLRLEYAVRLIRENPETLVNEVAEECAIPNTSTFYRLFKEKYGMTPVEFRDYQKSLQKPSRLLRTK